MGGFALPNGQRVVVMAHELVTDVDPVEMLEDQLDRARRLPYSGGNGTPRVIVYGDDEQFDTHKLVELAVDLP